MEEKKLTPQQRYKQKNVKKYYLEVVISTEKDIYDKLESVEKYSTYIKNLIREDIEKRNSNEN